MNNYLRQVFVAVVVLFVVLAGSSTIITAIRADTLSSDPRNGRTLYHEFDAPRGAILTSDGTVLAESTAVNDAFKYQRKYTSGAVYAAVTGYFSISQNADRGIEASRGKLLSGQSNTLFWQKFKSLFTSGKNQGATIETSIDTKLQTLAYKLLKGKDASLVAIEPSTGRIKAMVSTPSYDPNVLASHDTTAVNKAYSSLTSDSSNPMLNRATSELYPPGSTFKTVVAAAALETGKYTPSTMISAGSSYTLPGTSTKLTNVAHQANGVNGKISFEDALAYSSNTAFAQLGVKLGDSAVSAQAKKLGFGKSITLDGSNSTGLPIKAVSSSFPTGVSDDKVALASIGQGDTLETPLQNAMIAAAIANKGTLMQPTLVDCVRSSDLTVLSQTTPTVMSKAFSESTATQLTTMMEAVVSKEFTSLSIDGVKVAAKTGTAQIGTDNSSIDGWVIGFAPADDPKIAIAVVIHNVDELASYSVGPIMKQVMEEALKE
ncbi:penicillin-binding protein 2 [uncultured Bifidobacterium sp.]|uniref:peptidoglycan D,D-transpeptidase FtsI family protein n=1 Tax=uncultured Bifidobacterium sp. TaxID=165187 RepID=UPI002601BE7D|nr:penicillin-binding transpeptidase domain-containing protein [uncultured Bifidobacterium sp.]